MTTDPGRRQMPSAHGSPGGTGRAARPDGLSGDGAPPTLDQAFDVDSLYALRAAVAAHASQAGLSQDRADDLVVAVHELAANAVLHGAGHGRLLLWHRELAVQCQVSDDGPAAAPAAPAGTGDANAGPGAPDASAWHSEPGHGLWLVRHVADQSSVRSGPGGTVVTISFTLRPPG
jgi:anti-sigma regulatory factor (Ser/Thr protein kinase)